jgi:hypothetical protein
MHRKIKIALLVSIISSLPILASAAGFHDGKIYLQVEQNGEAWYINPLDSNRYYLGRPDDAFSIMRKFGLGISDLDLSKIPVGAVQSTTTDHDNDGLSDELEKLIGTDPYNPDSDEDDFSDFEEIQLGRNPLGTGKTEKNTSLISRLKGRILLQVEKNGEAWYVNPMDEKRYFLGRPTDAFQIMRILGIGITDENLNKISSRYVEKEFTANMHYTMKYPEGWAIRKNQKQYKEYANSLILEDTTFSGNNGVTLNIFVLQPKSHATLNDFIINKKTGTKKLADLDFLVGTKPARKQTLLYEGIIIDKEKIKFDNGAEYYIDIMVNTKKFIHLKFTVPNKSEIAETEKIMTKMLNDISIIDEN